MRKNIKLTTIFTCLVAFFASLILSLSFLITPAKADNSVFQMEYGASVKLSGNGLRFKAKMSQDYYDMLVTNDPNDDVLLYGYIAPIEVLDSMTEYSDFINGGKRVGGELAQDKIYQGEDGYYYVNIVMTMALCILMIIATSLPWKIYHIIYKHHYAVYKKSEGSN